MGRQCLGSFRHRPYADPSSPVAFSTLWDRLFGLAEIKVLILGSVPLFLPLPPSRSPIRTQPTLRSLDNAGKTTILVRSSLFSFLFVLHSPILSTRLPQYKISLGEVVATAPTFASPTPSLSAYFWRSSSSFSHARIVLGPIKKPMSTRT